MADGDSSMMRCRRIAILGLAVFIQAAVVLGPLVTPRPACAHDFPLKTMMNAFVKVEPTQAHLVIRVPLYLFPGTMFPALGRELDHAHAGPGIERALSIVGGEITLSENGVALVPSGASGRLTLPSDRSFESYDKAVAHVARPLEPGTTIYIDQGFFDVHLTYPIASPRSQFAIRTTLAPELKSSLNLAVRYLPLDGATRAYVISSLSGLVPLNPRWDQAAWGFVRFGIAHILSGIDHLLFLMCLVIPFRRLRGLLPVVTAFTVAHSITLISSAYDLVPAGAWFPPLVETLIAVSIVYMALENIVTTDLRHRWLITGMFGLVHGFSFSYGLKQGLQFAGSHVLVALFSFNIGIEIGQLFVLAVMLPILAVFLKYVLVGRIGMILLSAIVAHVGWHWMIERGDVLWQVEWPTLDAVAIVTLARWTLALLLAGGAAWLLARQFGRRRAVQRPRTKEEPA